VGQHRPTPRTKPTQLSACGKNKAGNLEDVGYGVFNRTVNTPIVGDCYPFDVQLYLNEQTQFLSCSQKNPSPNDPSINDHQHAYKSMKSTETLKTRWLSHSLSLSLSSLAFFPLFDYFFTGLATVRDTPTPRALVRTGVTAGPALIALVPRALVVTLLLPLANRPVEVRDCRVTKID
jgi:hypothetical protein